MMISGLTVLSPPDFVRTIANRHTASKGPNTIPSDALLLGLYHSTCGIRVIVSHRTSSYNRWVVSDQLRIAQDGMPGVISDKFPVRKTAGRTSPAGKRDSRRRHLPCGFMLALIVHAKLRAWQGLVAVVEGARGVERGARRVGRHEHGVHG